MFFHDASGAPLYAPYPLSISIPAMMLGHLTFAGLAEFIVSAGVVGYLQRASPEILESAASHAKPTQSLWPALALLVALTPLGILAAGTAWGEWKVEDFPGQVPAGLAHWSSLWKAPLADYAPSFIHNSSACLPLFSRDRCWGDRPFLFLAEAPIQARGSAPQLCRTNYPSRARSHPGRLFRRGHGPPGRIAAAP